MKFNHSCLYIQAVADVSRFVGGVHLLEAQGSDGNTWDIQRLFRHQPNVSGSGQIEFGGVAEDDGRVLGVGVDQVNSRLSLAHLLQFLGEIFQFRRSEFLGQFDFDFTLVAVVVVALKLRLQSVEQRIAVDIRTVDDHHLPEMKVAQQSRPHVRLMEEWRHRPQE